MNRNLSFSLEGVTTTKMPSSTGTLEYSSTTTTTGELSHLRVIICIEMLRGKPLRFLLACTLYKTTRTIFTNK